MSVTAVDGAPVVWTRGGTEWRARGRSPVPDTQLPTGDRPTGPAYVTYESLYTTGNTFRQVLAKVTGGRVLTLPEGVFSWSDFNQGYFDGLRIGNGGYTGCRGIVGSGEGTVLRMAPNSSTRGSALAAEITRIGTNPANMIHFNQVTAEVGNFKLVGDSQGHEYNGIRVERCNDAKLYGLHLVGASPGSKNAPPGETFGINVYRSPRCRLTDSEIDGRNEAGVRVCASPFGWNDTTDAYVADVYAHHALAGMPTWWETRNVEVHRTISFSNGSGSGGLNGQGFNMERAAGRIRFFDCTTKPWGKWEKQHGNTDPTLTDNSALHFSMNNDLEDMPDVQIHNPVHDRGPHSSGALAIYRGQPYGQGQKVTSYPRIFKNGVELQGRLSNNTSGVTANTHFIIYA